MFYYLLIFLSFSALSGFAEPYSYSILEHPYRFSTYFEMRSQNGFEGRAIKSNLVLRTSYDLYDSVGNLEARGIFQTLSLGSLFAWGKDIDVYDTLDHRIGLIDGEVLTTANAKYTFYDGNNQRVAIAYLDRACSGFVILSAQGERTIAHLKRNFVADTLDHWDIVLYEPQALDLRLLKIFSTFAIDYQEYFKEDR